MRAFLALSTPPDIVAYLSGVTARLARRTEGVRWVKSEGIHITVKFLGEIEEDLASRIEDALSPIGSQFAPIAACLGELDAFPTRRSARVIVVRLSRGAPEIQAVFSGIEERLAAIHVEKEKRGLVPHVTLGRRRNPKPFPDSGDMMPIEAREFVVDTLILYKSTLTPGGAMYEPVWKINLGGERS